MNTLLNRFVIERDSNVRKLEDNLFRKLAEITGPLTREILPNNNVKHVGVEDAIKELLEIEKTSQGN